MSARGCFRINFCSSIRSLFRPCRTQHALHPVRHGIHQRRGGRGRANGHQARATFGYFHGVIQISHIGQANGLCEVRQGARVARQDALGRHGVAAFAHALGHATQQAGWVVQRHNVQRDGEAVVLCLLDERELGRVREHGFAGERRARRDQGRAARVGPGAGGFGAFLGVGDVLQVRALVQVGVHEFERRPQDAIDLFVLPCLPESKIQEDTISVIEDLLDFGIDITKIRVLFNFVPLRDKKNLNRTFAEIFEFQAEQLKKRGKTFVANENLVMYEAEVFKQLGKLKPKMALATILADETDYEAAIVNSSDDDEKFLFSRLDSIRGLAKNTENTLSNVFNALVAGV